MTRHGMAAASVAVWAATALATNVIYYVDQEHPRAADTNAGTSEAAPFKTIQAAVDKAGADDMVLIKKGVYRETVVIRNGGVARGTPPFADALRWSSWLVLSAYGDDEVIIDGSEPVPPQAWQPATGQTGVYVARVEIPPGPDMLRPPRGVTSVYWKGVRLTPCLRNRSGAWQREPPGASDTGTWHYDQGTTNLYVNLGGADPRREQTGAVEAAVRAYGVTGGHYPGARQPDCVVVRKLTVRRTAWRAINLPRGSLAIVEDCQVYDAEHGIAGGGTQFPIVRRCVVHDICSRALELGGSVGGRFYDNVVYAFGQDWFREHNVFMPWAFILFGAEFGRYFHNVVLQPYEHLNPVDRGGGFWPDCHSPSHWFVGNAVYQAGTGFYIESPVQGNIVRWNTACRGRDGIVLAINAVNHVAENYVADNAVGCAQQGTESPWVRNNLFSRNWLKSNGTGLRMGPEPGTHVQTRNYAQGNVYEPRPGGRLARWAAADFTNLAAFTAATGQETLGAEAHINPEEPGLVWVRVDDTDASHEVIPLFGNPDCDRLTCLFDAEPFFWTRGVESSRDTFPGYWQYTTDERQVGDVFPGLMIFYRPWCEVAPGGVAAVLDGAAVSNTPVVGRYLASAALPTHGFGTNGVGWWSPSLPVVGGATVDVDLWMKLENVMPTPSSTSRGVGGCGAVVYVEWSDWTGQHKSRSYVVGGEVGSPPVHAELTTGTKGWTQVKGSVTAPNTARRMALFLGARGCSGKVGFDEIRTFAARPGWPLRRNLAGARPAGEPLVDPTRLRFFEINLSAAVNRALWDDVGGSGNGWQDRSGPGWDLRHVGVGRKQYGGVPFTVLGPKSCVVLDPGYRPEGRLPRSVTIPVNRKADVLYFLHTGTWLLPGPLPSGADCSWVYLVDYGNGYERIKVVPGVNVRDWGAQGPWRFKDTTAMRTTLPFESRDGTSVPVAGIACMEWVNPRQSEEIKAIVVNSGEGVPIILAITGGSSVTP